LSFFFVVFCFLIIDVLVRSTAVIVLYVVPFFPFCMCLFYIEKFNKNFNYKKKVENILLGTMNDVGPQLESRAI